MTVIFDEAELAAGAKVGSQRWVRHLGAKLHGHGDVLPPGPEQDDTDPQPGMPVSPAELHADDGFEIHLEEALGSASSCRAGSGIAARPAPAGSAFRRSRDRAAAGCRGSGGPAA